MGDIRTHKQQCCMDVPYSTLASGGDSSPKEKKQNKSNLLSTHALAHHKDQIGGLGYLHGRNQKITPAPQDCRFDEVSVNGCDGPAHGNETRGGGEGEEKRGGVIADGMREQRTWCLLMREGEKAGSAVDTGIERRK
jgi:hypothetical protein